MFLHSLFQQVDVSLDDVQVSQSAGTYAYRAYIESLLSYGPQAKTSQLTAALYYKDTAGNNSQYIQAFMSLFSGIGKENRDKGNDIAHEDYPNGYALYALDLARISPKKDISTWPSREPFALN